MARVQCPICAAVQDEEDFARGQVYECRACGKLTSGWRKVRRRRPPRPPRRGLGDLLAPVSAFGWVLIGLFVLWLGATAAALAAPKLARLLLVTGGGLVLVGNVWIGFVAYQDSQVFGLLCFCTCLFAYVYIVVNPDETWRPAGLTVLGLLFTLSGAVASQLAGVPMPTA
jgi:hypothetical protein